MKYFSSGLKHGWSKNSLSGSTSSGVSFSHSRRVCILTEGGGGGERALAMASLLDALRVTIISGLSQRFSHAARMTRILSPGTAPNFSMAAAISSLPAAVVTRVATALSRMAFICAHTCLCTSQSALWHASPQYATDLHAEQHRSSSPAAGGAVHLKQTRRPPVIGGVAAVIEQSVTPAPAPSLPSLKPAVAHAFRLLPLLPLLPLRPPLPLRPLLLLLLPLPLLLLVYCSFAAAAVPLFNASAPSKEDFGFSFFSVVAFRLPSPPGATSPQSSELGCPFNGEQRC
mmetsp:Transcript_5850/g.14855  ORF Transcript_5850/g.14855 Transcript_5850/m.14855 type:complete len:286 (-) Transcript_5850:135-992(-)